MTRHCIPFKYNGPEDDKAIIMAFSKNSIEERKQWLTKHMDECKKRKFLGLPESYVYTKTTTEITYREFINLELVVFSNADNIRSIPCVVDGLKPAQRRVLFTCFKLTHNREVNVEQLSADNTGLSLAQNFVGSNNINLLMPNGQFGTRLQGGKDSASPRYIFTMMSPLTRLIFHPHDDPLLDYVQNDNLEIEPSWYIPVIPMVLVNGCEGIGSGWSTKFFNHNPKKIISNLKRLIDHKKARPMKPWYKNFNGLIYSIDETRYLTVGNISILRENKIEITELPVGVWTQNYRENTLEPLLNGSKKQKAVITDYKEYHTDNTVRFVITLINDEFIKLERENNGFHRLFKLTSSMSMTQMHAFDANNCLRRYENTNLILEEFFTLRLEFYKKRKDYLQGMLEADASFLSNQVRFILDKSNNSLVEENKKRRVINELIERGFAPDPALSWKESLKVEREEQGAEEEEQTQEDDTKPSRSKPVDPEITFQKLTNINKYNYLVGMSLWMLTDENKKELIKQRDNKIAELNTLKAKTPESIWLNDLEVLEKKLGEIEEKERLEELGVNSKTSKAATKVKSERKRGAAAQTAVGDIYPSRDGISVRFKVTDDILEKQRKIIAAAAPKAKTGPEEKVEGEEKSIEADDFDTMVEGIKQDVVEEKPKNA